MPRQNIEKELRALRRVECRGTELEFGLNGHVFISDDSELSSEFYAIEAWGTDAEVSYTVEINGEDVALSGIVIPDGRALYGKIKNLDVTSGEVLAYPM
jgi:hypothetical protein